MPVSYGMLEFTATFLEHLTSRDFTAADRSATLKALSLFDNDDRHPSLRLHQLKGDRDGTWSASASRSLRRRSIGSQTVESGCLRAAGTTTGEPDGTSTP